MSNAIPVKRSVKVAGHATSISLEQAFWAALKDIAAQDGRPLAALIAEVDATRAGNLSSALRVHVLERLQAERETGNTGDVTDR